MIFIVVALIVAGYLIVGILLAMIALAVEDKYHFFTELKNEDLAAAVVLFWPLILAILLIVGSVLLVVGSIALVIIGTGYVLGSLSQSLYKQLRRWFNSKKNIPMR